ncbi:MAG: hypothetical protein GYB18_03310 [Oceanospirillales bacterium]|nr:hypothetical protein [Oceanospirillales bacterium]
MHKFVITVIASSLFLLTGCAGTGTKPNQHTLEKMSSIEAIGDTTHWYFREKAFGGKAATVIFVCNDEVYRVESGEFVECRANETINFMSADIGNGVYFTQLLENKVNMPASNQMHLNKNDGNHYIFGTTSIFGKETKTDNSIGVENTITPPEALQILSAGYKHIIAPDSISPILRYTGILNPYSKFKPGALSYNRIQPPQMVKHNRIESLDNKQGIIVFSTSNNLFSPGIWTEKNYQGSLDGSSYIFIETSNHEEILITYYGGKLMSLKVPVEKDEISYVELDTNLGWEVHNREFKLSNEQQFRRESSKLKHLALNRNADLEPSIPLIESEGLKILSSLNK